MNYSTVTTEILRGLILSLLGGVILGCGDQDKMSADIDQKMARIFTELETHRVTIDTNVEELIQMIDRHAEGLPAEMVSGLKEVVNNAIRNTGVEARCAADLVDKRLKNQLNVWKKLLPKRLYQIEEKYPVVCGADVNQILLTDETLPTLITLYGYDLQDYNVPPTATYADGRAEKIEIKHMSKGGPYSSSLNISRTGYNFDASLRKISFEGLDGAYEVPVTKARRGICRTNTIRESSLMTGRYSPTVNVSPKMDDEWSASPGELKGSVQLLLGTAEELCALQTLIATANPTLEQLATLDENGVRRIPSGWYESGSSHAYCTNADTTTGHVAALIQVEVSEIGGDETTFVGAVIRSIASYPNSVVESVDKSWQEFQLALPGVVNSKASGGKGGLIRLITGVGDRWGNELGHVGIETMSFNELSLVVRENGDCMPPIDDTIQ